MCLGVPGKVVQWIDRDPTFALAEVEFDGVRRQCYMACVPDAAEGSFVIVHAGIAICQMDAQQARRVLADLRSLEPQPNAHEFSPDDPCSERSRLPEVPE
jgi:hydrogenase expression/formation protein HypC